MSADAAILVLTQRGLAVARAVADALPGAEVLGFAPKVEGADGTFDDMTAAVRSLFAAGRPIVGVCAAGILIRCLAPVLADKRAEGAVLAVAENGSCVVPLLGGHRGANALARQIGARLGTAPALTTASDARFGVALDEPPQGWRLANPEHYKGFAARLLAGEAVRVEGAPLWLDAADLPTAATAPLEIVVTERAVPGASHRLVYHPARLALGVGCERGVPVEALLDLVRRCLAEAGLAEGAVAGVFSLDLKSDEPAIHGLAAAFGVSARFFDAAALEVERDRLAHPSEAVYREVGCHGVAEGAALAAAGAGAALVVPKTKGWRTTCAVARAPDILRPHDIGRGRGSLTVVGFGPGTTDWRTPEGDRALRRATDAVGYSLYLDLLGPPSADQRRHAFALGEEEDRVRTALDLAATGSEVALVSSGDAGIYAMAALVFECLERGGRADWRRVEIGVVPGISAMQAAAARVGAPLGHDFCAISLSDLLTPWPVIERRVRAAAEGDFVIAFYNPVSKRRIEPFERAIEILRAHRPSATPVVLAHSLGRAAERVEVTSLGDLSADRVDMLTLVLVGSKATRTVELGDGRRWVYTPRGYGAKRIDRSETGT
jgi:cobalt-precorrin 5A hydrolase/precorrin-3B C17-methyltransferase